MKVGIDLDGTVHRSNKLIPGSYEAIKYLNTKYEIYFLTNNSSRTPSYILNKVNKILSMEFHLSRLITPLLVAQYFFKGCIERIYIHGNKTVKKYMDDSNILLSESLTNSKKLLIGRRGSYTRNDIEKYCNFYNKNKNIYAFNKDMTFPTKTGFAIGNGALISDLEKELNVEIPSFGKPDDFFINYLISKNINLDYVIGDRIDTDMKLGNKLGSKSILLETGVYNSDTKIPKELNFKIYKDLKDFSLSV